MEECCVLTSNFLVILLFVFVENKSCSVAQARVECRGMIIAHCNLQFLGSYDNVENLPYEEKGRGVTTKRKMVRSL